MSFASQPHINVERQRAVVAALRSVLPDHCILSDAEDTRSYECDGLSAYRQLSLAVVLPEVKRRS